MSKILNVNMTGAEYIAAKEAQAASERTAAHTPGPWRVGGHTPGAGTVWRDIVTDALPYGPSLVATAQATDAALIAAAPETAAQRDDARSKLALVENQRDDIALELERVDEINVALHAACKELAGIMAATGDHVVYAAQWTRARAAIARAEASERRAL